MELSIAEILWKDYFLNINMTKEAQFQIHEDFNSENDEKCIQLPSKPWGNVHAIRQLSKESL